MTQVMWETNFVSQGSLCLRNMETFQKQNEWFSK